MGHKFNPTVLREYDIRGIVGQTLDGADAYALGRAYATTLHRQGGARICVGYDGRLSSPELEARLVAGLADGGVDVLRVGCGPTPMLYFAVHALQADGGIMVTGSHNPPDYNGFKMMMGGKSVFGAAITALGAVAAAGDHSTGAGTIETVEIAARYVDRLLAELDPDTAGLKIAWDPGNGAAGAVLAALCDKLPGTHVVINGEIDGRFPNHHPDPTVEANLEQLKAVVADQGCDLGIGLDGDGDRIGVVDSSGRVLWGDQLLQIYARDVLTRCPGAPIIADVKASQSLFDQVAALGGTPIMWKTGHSLIKSKMLDSGAPLAGEMSGHIFFAERFYGFDDALYAAVRLYRILAAGGRSLAALRDAMPSPVNTPELRIDCAEARKFDVVDEVKARLIAAGADVNTIDGVRVLTEDGWWLLRASNTQAALVARCESTDRAGLSRLKEQLVAQLAASGVPFS